MQEVTFCSEHFLLKTKVHFVPFTNWWLWPTKRPI